jgi:hypothetical protein
VRDELIKERLVKPGEPATPALQPLMPNFS